MSTDRQTDGWTPDRYIALSHMEAAGVKSSHHIRSGGVRDDSVPVNNANA